MYITNFTVKKNRTSFARGDIIVVPFPYSDLQSKKVRPALILYSDTSEDFIVLGITSQNTRKNSTKILDENFETGNLSVVSYVVHNKVATVNKRIIHKKIGALDRHTFKTIIDKFISQFRV